MLRAVDVAITPAAAALRAPAPLSVVIDVLRATSTIVTSLENGAASVVPVREQEEAITIMRRLGRDRSLLCGERDSQLIAGFDLDNSPASYKPDIVAGKTVILTTTNGTRALIEAANAKGVVFCGALLNRAAVAAALEATEGDEALLICAGDEGALSFEDFICAGAIVAQLEENRQGHRRDRRSPRRRGRLHRECQAYHECDCGRITREASRRSRIRRRCRRVFAHRRISVRPALRRRRDQRSGVTP